MKTFTLEEFSIRVKNMRCGTEEYTPLPAVPNSPAKNPKSAFECYMVNDLLSAVLDFEWS